MLPAEPYRITPAQAGVSEEVEPHPLACAVRPAPFISGNMLLGPCHEPVTALARRVFDICSGVDLDVFCRQRPTKQPTHSIEEIARLRRRGGTALLAIKN